MTTNKKTEGGTVAKANGIAVYQALAVKHGLKVYARTGMKVNTAYTPKNMIATASKITGQKFKARDFAGAIAALDAWIKAQMPEGESR